MNVISKLSILLLELNPIEFTALATILGYIFAEDLNSNQQQSLGSFFQTIGQIIVTIGLQKQNLNSNDIANSNIDDYINIIKKKIGNIDKILSDLKNLNI